jgi:hypothetical protein
MITVMRQKHILLFIVLLGALPSCKKFLDKGPTSSITPDEAFNTAGDLQLYVNSFYNTMLPTLWGNLADNMPGITASNYLNGQFTSTQAGNWTWTNLRNVNYFLQNYNNPAIDNADRANYGGIAHFFRAYFYYNMVKLFGNVPWYDTPLPAGDPALYKTQDPRALVMDSVLADINFACQNISATTDPTCTQVTKWIAYALKSRICLFEGTFRKYHTELQLTSTAAQWLQLAADAADTVIAGGKYKLHSTGNPLADYRALFINETPSNDEIMLAAVYSDALSHWNDGTYWFNSPTFGNRLSFTKDFINTYLNSDGSRFTDNPVHDTIEFQFEVQNRDARLSQTIRMAPYTQNGTAAPPNFAYTYTGYHPLKFAQDNPALNTLAQNNNAISIFRYAEVLLNYAEAKEELGTLTLADWTKTIGALRARAGITNTGMPTVADPYLVSTYYPDISDPVLLEIRRERGIELTMEGFRYDDIRRWKEGQDLVKPYDGIYVPALNQLLDLNQDGKPDVCFVTVTPTTKVAGVYYFVLDNNSSRLAGGTKGDILWLQNLTRTWTDNKYYYPIPFSELQLNPNLVQNPGW